MTKLIFFYIRATFHPHFLFLGTKKFSSLGAKNFLSPIFNPTETKKSFCPHFLSLGTKKLCWFLFTLNKVQNGREDENLGLELRKVVPYIENILLIPNFLLAVVASISFKFWLRLEKLSNNKSSENVECCENAKVFV